MTAQQPYNERDLLNRGSSGGGSRLHAAVPALAPTIGGLCFPDHGVAGNDRRNRAGRVPENLDGAGNHVRDKNFKHFLLVVSRNQAFDALRKNLREEARKRTWEAEGSSSLYAEPATSDQQDPVVTVIEAAIDALPRGGKKSGC